MIAARLFRRVVGLGLAGAVMAASGASAQQMPIETIDLAERVEHLNSTNVADALSTVSGNQLETVDGDGLAYIAATATNGLRFDVHFRACLSQASENAPSQCKAMYMISVWDALAPDAQRKLGGTVLGYMPSNPTVNAGILPDGKPYLVRYVIADHGTNKGNLVAEFANFVRSATEYQNAIAPLYAAPAE